MKRSIWISTIVAAAAIAVPAFSAASGGGGGVSNAGECTGASTSKIKAKHDDGRIEVQFEVDQNRNGVQWHVRLKDNGNVVFHGTRTTMAPSGSFEVNKRIPNLAGADHIKGLARNTQSDERCAASVSV